MSATAATQTGQTAQSPQPPQPPQPQPAQPPRRTEEDPEFQKVGIPGTTALGVYLAVLALLIFYLLVQLFTAEQHFDPNDRTVLTSVEVHWFCWTFERNPEGWLLLIVILAGALGSYVHAATSYADYVGNRELRRSWIWWMILRTPISVALALVFYLLLRGGLLTGVDTESVNVLNPYGFAATSALVGMFAKQATDKLREIFDSLFRTEKKTGRSDRLAQTLDNPKPSISKMTPATLRVNETALSVAVEGRGFVAKSQVKVGGKDRQTKVEGDTSLTFELSAADVGAAGTLQVTVANPAPGGGESPAHELPVIT